MRLKNQEIGPSFELLRHHPIFAVQLSSRSATFIANARYLSPSSLQAFVLDGSEFLDELQSDKSCRFEIQLPDQTLKGEALATLGESRIGSSGQRFVTVTLRLSFAEEVTPQEGVLPRWLT